MLFSQNVILFLGRLSVQKSQISGKIEATKNTYCIHHYSGSWMSLKEKRLTHIKRKLMGFIGVKNVETIIRILQLKKLKKYL